MAEEELYLLLWRVQNTLKMPQSKYFFDDYYIADEKNHIQIFLYYLVPTYPKNHKTIHKQSLLNIETAILWLSKVLI